jgi:hypothetical protein
MNNEQIALDGATWCLIANCAFLSDAPSRLGNLLLPYTVQWRVLGRLACTCKALNAHLLFLDDFARALDPLLSRNIAPQIPLERWGLTKEQLRKGVTEIPIMPKFGKQRNFTLSPSGDFHLNTVHRIRMPSLFH